MERSVEKLFSNVEKLFSNEDKEDKAGKYKAEGDTMFENQDWAGAFKVYEKGLHSLPKRHQDRATFHNQLSYCLMNIKPIDYAKVISHCSKTLAIKSNDFPTLLRRAVAYEALGEVSTALVDLSNLLKAQPKNKMAKEMWERLYSIEKSKAQRDFKLKALQNELEKELEEKSEKEASVSSLGLDAKWGGSSVDKDLEEELEIPIDPAMIEEKPGSSVSSVDKELEKALEDDFAKKNRDKACNEGSSVSVSGLEKMVLSVEKLFSRLFGKEDVRILMMGLDAAGKTTILDMIKHGEIVMPTTPTINCNVKTLEYNNISFSVWDAYGQDKKHYFHRTHGLIFVVDCNDHDRIMEAKDELHLMLKKAELRDAVLLIFANNQALPNAMDNTTIIDKLELYSLHQQGWYIQSTSASSEDGIYEGLDWLSKKIAYKDFSTAEVRIDVDHLGYLWAPATFINENQNGTLQMKFVRERNNFKKKTSLETYNSLGGGIEDISLSRIRPSPPDFGLRVYSLLEKVDVHLESGWCPGVVTKICFGRKYYVRFGRDNRIMYFDYWQVRPCREWKDRFWLTNEEKGLGSEQNPHAVEGGVEDLIHLLFFGFLFTREDERDWCAIDSHPLNRSDYLQSISEFKSISLLSRLLYQSFVPDKKEALKCCIKHAKLWLANSDQLVNYSNCRVSYARLKNKLKNIMESPYFISAEMTTLRYTRDFSWEKVVVFWDFENAHVPRGQDPSEIFENIISALKKLNLNGDVEMVGIGDTNIIKKHLDTLKKSGITFMHVSGGENNDADEKIIVEMSFWAYNHLEVHHAPGSILLITDTHKKLRKVANSGWLWKDLVKGEIAEALIEKLRRNVGHRKI